MLSIHLGDYPGSIYDTETYFRNSYLDSWFEDPMAAQIIKSVDGSELIGPHNIVRRAQPEPLSVPQVTTHGKYCTVIGSCPQVLVIIIISL